MLMLRNDTQHFCLYLIGYRKSCGQANSEFNRTVIGMCQLSAGTRVRTIIQSTTAVKNIIWESVTNSQLPKDCSSGHSSRLAHSWHGLPLPPPHPWWSNELTFTQHTKQKPLRHNVAVNPIRLASADLWPFQNPFICWKMLVHSPCGLFDDFNKDLGWAQPIQLFFIFWRGNEWWLATLVLKFDCALESPGEL